MYQTTTLPNGLTVLTHPMPHRESVALGVWVKVGSRYEPNAIAGISHFIEHLLFKGTQRRTAQQIKESIEGVGGQFNAFTSEEVTCYYVKILRQHAWRALDVLADMLERSLFAPADIQKERTVVLEEIKMYYDMPSQHVHELINELLWPKQPLGRNVAGDATSMSRITRRDILQFTGTHYQPHNVLVAACGDITHDDHVRAVKQCFSVNGKSKRPSSFRPARIAQRAPQLLCEDRKTEQTHFVLGLHGLPRTHEDRTAASLLHIILGANMSSRLFEEVREKRGLAYEIRSGLGFYQDTGAFAVSAGVENKKTHQALRVILKELRKVTAHTVKPDELVRAKEYFLGQLYLMLEDTLDYMSWLGEKALYLDAIPTPDEIRRKVERLTADDLRRVARKFFKTNHLNLALVGPADDKFQKRLKNVLSF